MLVSRVVPTCITNLPSECGTARTEIAIPQHKRHEGVIMIDALSVAMLPTNIKHYRVRCISHIGSSPFYHSDKCIFHHFQLVLLDHIPLQARF